MVRCDGSLLGGGETDVGIERGDGGGGGGCRIRRDRSPPSRRQEIWG